MYVIGLGSTRRQIVNGRVAVGVEFVFVVDAASDLGGMDTEFLLLAVDSLCFSSKSLVTALLEIRGMATITAMAAEAHTQPAQYWR